MSLLGGPELFLFSSTAGCVPSSPPGQLCPHLWPHSPLLIKSRIPGSSRRSQPTLQGGLTETS